MSGGSGGQRVVAGRYRLLDELGRGGMGVVWRARDEVLLREVAVKEVHAPANLLPAEVERLYQRLEREGWAAARIAHRNVVTVYDVATDDGRPWIVMELVRGLSLADVLDAEGPLPPARAAAVGAEVVAALRGAHESGVLHRDVKPGNILLADDGRVVLTDFGIAVIEGGSALTMTGELIGSPEFLPPERALGRTPGPASDLWSLGVTLYAAVEGFSPFRQNTPLGTMRAVVDAELPAPLRAGPLAPVLDGMLRKDPEERLPADETEGMLRTVAAGGTAYTPTAVAAPAYTPTVHSEQATPATAMPVPAAGAGAGTASTAATGRRSRRGGVLVVVGLLALLLGAGGAAWALLGGDGDGGDAAGADGGSQGEGASGGEGGSSGQGTGGDDGGSAGQGTGDGGGGDGGGGDGNDGGQTGGHDITVQVTVTALRDSYSGSCPPPDHLAPSFRGTISVSGTPADVSYRWVTESGEDGTGWRTASFGDSTEQNVDHTVLTYAEDSSYEDSIGIEVKSPQQAQSNEVYFTTTCESPEPEPDPEYEEEPAQEAEPEASY